MNLLAIDPASKITGYAVLRGLRASDLVDAGVLRSSMARGAIDVDALGLSTVEQRWIREYNSDAIFRTHSMLPDVRQLLLEHRPYAVVVEMPSGKAGTGSKAGASGALTSYGAAAGIQFAWIDRTHCHVLPVSERVWTKGQASKTRRQQACLGLYPGRYTIERDTKTGDLADAITLGRWAWQRLDAEGFFDAEEVSKQANDALMDRGAAGSM